MACFEQFLDLKVAKVVFSDLLDCFTDPRNFLHRDHLLTMLVLVMQIIIMVEIQKFEFVISGRFNVDHVCLVLITLLGRDHDRSLVKQASFIRNRSLSVSFLVKFHLTRQTLLFAKGYQIKDIICLLGATKRMVVILAVNDQKS